ncbi:winged helix-turn-helix domain-containing protein [Streptomyces sp. NBC_01016]|uniref:winged helix-turn-helix domain-containing protein n=1 Tax=Streptomyces sp. NBC_01016 TaxID=2903720 RepID=UPI00225A9C14|nr:winged helix-turn-helix domain-containing protein [Streptomyces sp. NBC_01016]MCX4827860.1 winged helix-turn-helix domain-containing protein [Streptomyces sp. NBC_01016]
MDQSPEAPKQPPTAKDIAAEFRAKITGPDSTYDPGDRLPAARTLAKERHVQLMTVQSAYSQLRDEGLVLSQQGRGTFVRDPAAPPRHPAGKQSGVYRLGRRAQHDSRRAPRTRRAVGSP